MDTTANSLARIWQLLAENPDAQERLREEIKHAVETEGEGDTLDFDKLMELPYLDAVCRETLRVCVIAPCPSLLFHSYLRFVQQVTWCRVALQGVSRRPCGPSPYFVLTIIFSSFVYSTIKDTIMPLSEPIRLRDGTLTSALPIPKGTRIVANISSTNRDPALWGPDADKWRPDRWLEPLPREVEEAHVPGVYSHLCVVPHHRIVVEWCTDEEIVSCRMTFIGGSRACM